MHDAPKIILAPTVMLACIAGCCGTVRSPAMVQTLEKEERARLARLPSDGRGFDARWSLLHVDARDQHGVISGSLELREPNVRLFRYGGPPQSNMPDLQASLRKLTPMDVNDLDVYSGQLLIAELGQEGKPELWLHDLEVSLENVGTRRRFQDNEPVLLTVRGRVQRSGELVAFITVDPWGQGLDFAGRVEITGLRTEELYRFIKPATGVRAPEGTIDLYIAFVSEGGRIRGGIKPVVKNLELRSTGSAWSCFKAKTGDAFLSLFGRGAKDRLATVVPIEGQLRGPSVEVWPTIFGILYDSFIHGIAAGFGGLPPPLAMTAQSPAGQAGHVVVEGNRPLAQPRPADGSP